jgi:hypothetical protein
MSKQAEYEYGIDKAIEMMDQLTEELKEMDPCEDVGRYIKKQAWRDAISYTVAMICSPRNKWKVDNDKK